MVEGHVLVLNKSWVVVNIASVRRALSLLYQGMARAVHPTDYSLYDFDDWCQLSPAFHEGRYIHTTSRKIRVPEVIILNMFNGFIRQEVRFSRRNIFERDDHTCQYCGKKFCKQDLTLDHVVPQSRGGGNTWENLVLACVPCNVRKGSRTPEEAHMPMLRRPKKPTWLPRMGYRLPQDAFSSWQRFVDSAYWDVELKP
jgi:5-methylcytosine-specific restriction endonuclease McrA